MALTKLGRSGLNLNSQTTSGIKTVGANSNDIAVGGTSDQAITFSATGTAVTIDNNGSLGGTLSLTKSSSGNALVVNTNKFLVAADTGNSTIAGTVSVTGAATLSDTLAVTGNSTLSGTLAVNNTGATALNINSGKFTVNGNTGDTTIIGGGSVKVQLAKPGVPTVGAATSGGTLTVSTYHYRVTAIDKNGNETDAGNSASGTTDTTNKTLPVSWTAVTGAVSYKLYRGSSANFATADVAALAVSGTSQTDTGATFSAGTPTVPTTNNAFIYRVTSTGAGNFDGTLTGYGDVAIKSNSSTTKFAVIASTGDTTVSGTLAVTGASTLTGNVTASGDLIVSGNLTVSGDTITANVATMLVEDPLITINSGDAAVSGTALAGLKLLSGAAVDRYLVWDGTVFALFNNTSESTTSATYDDLRLAGLRAATIKDISGNTKLTLADGGAITSSVALDMGNQLITNIGDAGTDFTSGGGLALAGNLNINSSKFLVTASTGVVDIAPVLGVLGVGASSYGAKVAAATFTEAASGTHARISGLEVTAPDITDGVGATTDAVTLYVSGAPTGAIPTNAYALWVNAGNTKLGGALTVDGAVTLGAAGTALTVTNNATISGNLTVSGTTTLNGNVALGNSVTFTSGGTGDAAGRIGYTPATPGNWSGSADPGEVNGALDQLASRTKTLEASTPTALKIKKEIRTFTGTLPAADESIGAGSNIGVYHIPTYSASASTWEAGRNNALVSLNGLIQLQDGAASKTEFADGGGSSDGKFFIEVDQLTVGTSNFGTAGTTVDGILVRTADITSGDSVLIVIYPFTGD